MGKASEWIRNFLMGKKEDKVKKTSPSIPAETPHKVKRRWSFKKSTSTKAILIMHKITNSYDSILMPKECLTEYQTPQKYALPPVMSPHAAATKIQATYRSYLARRALSALRGLVKLQAVARGYLVRKQMNAVAKSMHALMVIQVRARIHRVQMADEPAITGPRKSCKESLALSERQLRRENSEDKANEIILQRRGCLRSQSGRRDTIPVERVEYAPRCSSARLSVSQREHQPKMYPSPSMSSFTDSTSTTYDWQQEFSPKTAQKYSKKYSACPENKQLYNDSPAQYPIYAMSNSDIVPSYMTNTRSSKAKSRSHSEPKKRPNLGKKQKSRRSSSIDVKNEKENMYPWLIKLYRSSNFMNDGDCDPSTSVIYGRKSLSPFEPPMSLY